MFNVSTTANIRIYGDKATSPLTGRLKKPVIEPATPSLQDEWFIHSTMMTAYYSSMKIVSILANSEEPEEMPQDVASLLDLYCL